MGGGGATAAAVVGAGFIGDAGGDKEDGEGGDGAGGMILDSWLERLMVREGMRVKRCGGGVGAFWATAGSAHIRRVPRARAGRIG